jgi:hypothetical protein
MPGHVFANRRPTSSTVLLNGHRLPASRFVRDKVKGLGRLIPDWLKEVLGIKSPSTETADVAGHTVDGLLVGFEKKIPALKRTLSAYRLDDHRRSLASHRQQVSDRAVEQRDVVDQHRRRRTANAITPGNVAVSRPCGKCSSSRRGHQRQRRSDSRQVRDRTRSRLGSRGVSAAHRPATAARRVSTGRS